MFDNGVGELFQAGVRTINRDSKPFETFGKKQNTPEEICAFTIAQFQRSPIGQEHTEGLMVIFLVSFEKIKNVKLHAASCALDSLKAAPLHTHQIIHDDGTVEIPAVAKEVLFPFILSQEGNVRLLEPAELKSELKSKLQKMLEQC